TARRPVGPEPEDSRVRSLRLHSPPSSKVQLREERTRERSPPPGDATGEPRNPRSRDPGSALLRDCVSFGEGTALGRDEVSEAVWPTISGRISSEAFLEL
ncbi:Dual specificity protein phosphatase Diacylglycerol kinase catalytic region, partial [Zea mays]